MKRIIYDVPKWHVFQHRLSRGLPLAETNDDPRMRFEDELFDRIYSGDAELLPEKQKSVELRQWAEQIHAVCDQLPEFQRLSTYCRGDVDAAGLAVEELMTLLEPQMQKQPDQVAAPVLRRAVNAACGKAVNAIDDHKDAVEALGQIGWGTGRGNAKAGEQVQRGKARSLAERLKQDKRLSRIAMLAGRFKRIAQAKQRSKVKHGADEIADVELGADIGRLLPTELARLTQPSQRLAFLRDLTERRCMQYRLSGTEPLGKGPLVVLLDKSGSMDGDKDIWATAVALALLDIAQRQRRHFVLLCFESVVRYEVTVLPGDALPEEALFVSCGGGTEIAAAVQRGLNVIEENPGKLRKADLVLITDGCSDASAAPVAREWAKALGVTIIGAGIGVRDDELLAWCDSVCAVQQFDTLDDKAADQLLAI